MSGRECSVVVTQKLTWGQRVRLWWHGQILAWRALLLGTTVTRCSIPEQAPAERHDTAEGPFFYTSGGDKVH